MGRERYQKQSLGALYGRIKQVCLLHAIGVTPAHITLRSRAS